MRRGKGGPGWLGFAAARSGPRCGPDGVPDDHELRHGAPGAPATKGACLRGRPKTGEQAGATMVRRGTRRRWHSCSKEFGLGRRFTIISSRERDRDSSRELGVVEWSEGNRNGKVRGAMEPRLQ